MYHWRQCSNFNIQILIVSDSEIEDDEQEGVQNFSKPSLEDDKEKGEAVKNQLGTCIFNNVSFKYFFPICIEWL